ncbi:MAG TPA: glycosyltransferase [Aliidongia sp.]|nr:glycosyltransferase [Aliidongia sp.]
MPEGSVTPVIHSRAVAATTAVIAVVVPLFKHTELVVEAILSALDQKGPVELRIVIVNDGCPYPGSYDAALAFARSEPERVAVIRQRNGGLSAARNTGVDFALAVWPELQAIYFLDADNRLYPDFIAKSWRVLCEHPEAGWVYPDIDMFGEAYNYDVGGDYSLLQHLLENTCEAGSLVRRSIFDAGIRYDESMRLGFEDWDFWLQSAGAGFRGVHGPAVGFRYRKRRESMLRNSERDRAEIVGYMRRKHKKLYAPPNLLRLEHEEAPRYAIILADRMVVALTSDPTRLDRIVSWEEFRAMLRLSRIDGRRYPCPSYVAVTHPTFLSYLTRLKLANWTFWRLEDSLRQHNFAVAEAVNDGKPQALGFTLGTPEHPLDLHALAGLVMVQADLLTACLSDPDRSWTMSLGRARPDPRLFELSVEAVVPTHFAEIWTAGMHEFLSCFSDLHAWWHAQADERGFSWREAVVTPKPKLPLAVRDILEVGPLHPMLPLPGERHVGFILPVAQFGGVEKVARAVARELRASGWTPHLFVFAASSVGDLDDLTDIFETINFLDDPGIGAWTPDGKYFGAGFPAWAANGDHARALGLLGAMQAVVNCHSADAHGIMGELRRLGIASVAHLHLIDASRHGQPVGFVYQTLGYEHCYDQILVISENLHSTCVALGVPTEKLMHVPNAPSYPMTEEAVASILAARPPLKGRKLRCLYLGRFDRQKGLYRVAHLAQICTEAKLPVEWRVVGGQILAQDGADAELAPIANLVEPAVRDPEHLSELYGWADILVLPSHFEGVPLTVLEAMRLGVVVLATDVGAVKEAVEHDVDGYLFHNGDDQTLQREMLATLQRLANDPERLAAVSAAAADRASRWQWRQSCRPLVDFLETKCPAGAPGSNATKN